MQLQFKVTFKRSLKTVAEVIGLPNHVDAGNLTIEEVIEGVQHAEEFLEKLTGYRVHIEQVQ